MFNNYLTVDEAMRAIEIIATVCREQREHIESLKRRIEKLEEAEVSRSQREKGKRGERELAGILKSYGYDAKRGVQYHGGPESPDVVGLPGIHIEVKRVERLNVDDAVDQAVCDSGDDELAAVFHRKNGRKWNVTMPMEDWMKLYERRLDAV